jgi:hypothetical protein
VNNEPIIDKDLTDRVNALKAITNIFDLLNSGHFPRQDYERLNACMRFLSSLHETMLNHTRQHPEAHKIEGLLNE